LAAPVIAKSLSFPTAWHWVASAVVPSKHARMELSSTESNASMATPFVAASPGMIFESVKPFASMFTVMTSEAYAVKMTVL
jgi:hypothetical protein